MPLPEPGSILNERYELYRVLGSGGFGVVFAATDLQTGEPRAVKLMLAHLVSSNDLLTRRFQREVAIASRINHPNVVAVRDFGVAADDSLFYAMELLDGSDLAAHLAERGPLRAPVAVHVFEQVLDALAEAHRQGVVHRDIKPTNIFISPTDGDRWFTRVLDFGIAKSLDAADRESINRAGTILGTPQYMAPETVATGTYLPASDVYAVGLSLFEALTGRPMFQGHPAEVLVRQMRPERPSLPDVLSGTPVGEFIERCLKREPAQRFRSATEALRRLREIAATAESLPTIAAPVELRGEHAFEGHEVALSLDDRQRLAKVAASGPVTEAPAGMVAFETFAPLDDDGWDRLRGAGSGDADADSFNWVLTPVLVAVVLVAAYFAFRVFAGIDPNLGSVGFDGADEEPVADFVMRVDSQPSGARLRINGNPLGTTPRVVTVRGEMLPVSVTVGQGDTARTQVVSAPTNKLVLSLPEGAELARPADVPLNVESDESFDLDDIDYEGRDEINLDPHHPERAREQIEKLTGSLGAQPTRTKLGRKCGKYVKGESEQVEVVVRPTSEQATRVSTRLLKPRPDASALLECVKRRFARVPSQAVVRTVVKVEARRHAQHQERMKEYRESNSDEKQGPDIEYAQ